MMTLRGRLRDNTRRTAADGSAAALVEGGVVDSGEVGGGWVEDVGGLRRVREGHWDIVAPLRGV